MKVPVRRLPLWERLKVTTSPSGPGSLFQEPDQAADVAGEVGVSDAWARATAPGQDAASVQMTLTSNKAGAVVAASGTAALGNCLATDVVQTLFADIDWHNYNRQTEIKLVCADEAKFGPVTRNLFYQLHSLPFLRLRAAARHAPGAHLPVLRAPLPGRRRYL